MTWSSDTTTTDYRALALTLAVESVNNTNLTHSDDAFTKRADTFYDWLTQSDKQGEQNGE